MWVHMMAGSAQKVREGGCRVSIGHRAAWSRRSLRTSSHLAMKRAASKPHAGPKPAPPDLSRYSPSLVPRRFDLSG